MKIKLNSTGFLILSYLILNGLIGFLSLEILKDMLNFSMYLWVEMFLGYFLGIFLIPIVLLLVFFKAFMGF